MMCGACVAVVVDNLIVLYRTIFSCAGDRLAKKVSLYVEL